MRRPQSLNAGENLEFGQKIRGKHAGLRRVVETPGSSMYDSNQNLTPLGLLTEGMEIMPIKAAVKTKVEKMNLIT